MNNVRLVCGGQAVDLPTDFGILINKSIADIREPEKKSSDWTKTFTLPGTKANNKLFSHLFDINARIQNTTSTNFAPDFNPNLKANAALYVDEVVQISGFIRLTEIKVNDRNEISYDCTMHGQFADLFATIADGRLSDLDFSEYNHTLNITNITESWDTRIQKNGSNYVNFSGGNPTGEGYVYGWIDNGEYSNYTRIYTDDMTPFIYAKTVVDKIFSGAGYSYTSGSFFNSNQFKRLVIPCPTQFPRLSESAAQNRLFEATRNSNQTYTAGQTIVFNNEVSDPSNQYNPSTGEFTNGFNGQAYNLFFYNNSTTTGLTTATSYIARYELWVNGSLRTGVSKVYNTGVSTTLNIDETYVFANITLNASDVAVVKFIGLFPFASNTPAGSYTQNSGSKFYNGVNIAVPGYNQTVNLSVFFPDEVKQRDFMRWIFTLFNIYIEPDEDSINTLVCKTRDDFYTSDVVDWSDKRDLSQDLEIIPMGELESKRYKFTYTAADDEGNKEYTADFDRIYGDRLIEVDNQFVKDEKKIEVGFAPTLLNKFPNNDKYVSYIENGNTTNQRFYTGKLRIMQYKAISCNAYDIYHGANGSSSFTTVTKYPYMGHLDDPTNSTSDLAFGMPRRVALPPGTPYTNNNLYNAYYKKYITEITDKDSKIVRGWFHLTPSDMELLSFQKTYYFDENYFRLQKIEDYDPINPSVCQCEFLLLAPAALFSGTTGTIGSGGSTEQEYDPIGGGTNGKVIQSKGISIGQQNNVGDGLAVGDSITNEGRANVALGTSGQLFFKDIERSVVIGKTVENPQSDSVHIQGHEITENNLFTNRITEVTSSPYTASLNDDILIVTNENNTTINLPTAASAIIKKYTIKKMSTGAYTVTLDPDGSEQIDATANYVFGTQYAVVNIISDGSEWFII